MRRKPFKQKLRRGDRVRGRPSRWDATMEREGIVLHSYNDQYGGGDMSQFCVLWLDTDGSFLRSQAWYSLAELTFLRRGTLEDHDMIQEYNEREL